MRKRIKIQTIWTQKYIRIACATEKGVKYLMPRTMAIFAGLIMLSCTSNAPSYMEADEYDRHSVEPWEIYCQKYGVDEEYPTTSEEDYYLDCYAGSYEEECDIQAYQDSINALEEQKNCEVECQQLMRLQPKQVVKECVLDIEPLSALKK